MMSRDAIRLLRCCRGGSAIEFSLVLFPFLLLIFGTIEFGRLMWTREALQQTAIVGARCMGMTQNACGTQGVYDPALASSYVQAQAKAWSIPLTAANMVLNNAATCAGIAGFSQVSLTYTFTTVVPKVLLALAGGGVLTATACFPNHT